MLDSYILVSPSDFDFWYHINHRRTGTYLFWYARYAADVVVFVCCPSISIFNSPLNTKGWDLLPMCIYIKMHIEDTDTTLYFDIMHMNAVFFKKN